MAAAGWYPDPERPENIRWWDGAHWADNSQPAAAPQPSRYSPVETVYPAAYAAPHPAAVGMPATAVGSSAVPDYALQQAAATGTRPRSVFGMALPSVILGTLAILFGWYVPLIGLLAAPAGLTLGIVALARRTGGSPSAGGSAAGTALAAVGTALSGVALLIAVAALIVWTALNTG